MLCVVKRNLPFSYIRWDSILPRYFLGGLYSIGAVLIEKIKNKNIEYLDNSLNLFFVIVHLFMRSEKSLSLLPALLEKIKVESILLLSENPNIPAHISRIPFHIIRKNHGSIKNVLQFILSHWDEIKKLINFVVQLIYMPPAYSQINIPSIPLENMLKSFISFLLRARRSDIAKIFIENLNLLRDIAYKFFNENKQSIFNPEFTKNFDKNKFIEEFDKEIEYLISIISGQHSIVSDKSIDDVIETELPAILSVVRLVNDILMFIIYVLITTLYLGFRSNETIKEEMKNIMIANIKHTKIRNILKALKSNEDPDGGYIIDKREFLGVECLLKLENNEITPTSGGYIGLMLSLILKSSPVIGKIINDGKNYIKHVYDLLEDALKENREPLSIRLTLRSDYIVFIIKFVNHNESWSYIEALFKQKENTMIARFILRIPRISLYRPNPYYHAIKILYKIFKPNIPMEYLLFATSAQDIIDRDMIYR